MFSLQIRMLLQHCRVSASLIFVYCLQSDDSSSGGFTLQQQLCQNTNSGNMKSGEEAALCTALASGLRTADTLRCSVIIIKAKHQDWIVVSSPFILAHNHPGPGCGPNNTISVISLLHTFG